MNQLKEVSLDNMAGGVAKEIFQRELAVVARNIADLNTDPKKTRTITLQIKFSPDEQRSEVKVNIQAKSTIASVKPAQKTIYLGKKDGKPTLLGNNPEQGEFNLHDENVTVIGQKSGVVNV